MTDQERAADRHGATDEHLDAAQDEVSGEAAPGPAQRNEPAPDTGGDVRNTGNSAMSEANRPANQG